MFKNLDPHFLHPNNGMPKNVLLLFKYYLRDFMDVISIKP